MQWRGLFAGFTQAAHFITHILCWARTSYDVAFGGSFGVFPLTPHEKWRTIAKIHTRAAPGEEDQDWQDFMAKMRVVHRDKRHWDDFEPFMDKRCYRCG